MIEGIKMSQTKHRLEEPLSHYLAQMRRTVDGCALGVISLDENGIGQMSDTLALMEAEARHQEDTRIEAPTAEDYLARVSLRIDELRSKLSAKTALPLEERRAAAKTIQDAIAVLTATRLLVLEKV